MITFICQMTVRPENAAAYEAIMTEVRDQSLANEPGVAWYSFAKSAEEPDRYLIVEVYRDAQAHASHMETSWVTRSLPRAIPLVEGKFDIRQFVSPGTEPAVRRFKEPQ